VWCSVLVDVIGVLRWWCVFVFKSIVLDIGLMGVIVFRSDCKVFGCISSKSEQNWCFELVEGYLAFELVFT
jgi:hypothetical protein